VSKIKGDEPAFPKPLDPYPNTSGTATLSGHPGMDQRTYIATKALAGMLAHSTRYRPRPGSSTNWHEAIAEEACELADALIAALNAEHGHDR